MSNIKNILEFSFTFFPLIFVGVFSAEIVLGAVARQYFQSEQI